MCLDYSYGTSKHDSHHVVKRMNKDSKSGKRSRTKKKEVNGKNGCITTLRYYTGVLADNKNVAKWDVNRVYDSPQIIFICHYTVYFWKGEFYEWKWKVG